MLHPRSNENHIAPKYLSKLDSPHPSLPRASSLQLPAAPVGWNGPLGPAPFQREAGYQSGVAGQTALVSPLA